MAFEGAKALVKEALLGLSQMFAEAAARIPEPPSKPVADKIPENSNHPLDRRMQAVFSASDASANPSFLGVTMPASRIADLLASTAFSEQIVEKSNKGGVQKEVRNFLDGRQIAIELAPNPDREGDAGMTVRVSTKPGQEERGFALYGRVYSGENGGNIFCINTVSYAGIDEDGAEFIVTETATIENVGEVLSIMEETFPPAPTAKILPFRAPANEI